MLFSYSMNSMADSSNNFNCVDIAKYIMAFAVVAIHVQALYINETGTTIYPFVVEWFIRLAVPFFFIASGWLMHRKISRIDKFEAIECLDKKTVATFKALGLWVLIYLPISIIYYWHCGSTVIHNICVYLFNLLIKGESYFAWTLWYLYALAIGIIALRITCNRTNYQVIAYILFIAGYLVANQYIHASQYFSLLCDKPLGGGIYILSGWFLFSIMSKHHFSKVLVSGIALLSSIVLYYFKLPFWQIIGGLGIYILCLSINFKSRQRFYLSLRL